MIYFNSVLCVYQEYNVYNIFIFTHIESISYMKGSLKVTLNFVCNVCLILTGCVSNHRDIYSVPLVHQPQFFVF